MYLSIMNGTVTVRHPSLDVEGLKIWASLEWSTRGAGYMTLSATLEYENEVGHCRLNRVDTSVESRLVSARDRYNMMNCFQTLLSISTCAPIMRTWRWRCTWWWASRQGRGGIENAAFDRRCVPTYRVRASISSTAFT